MIYDKICCMLPTYGRSRTYLPEFIKSVMISSDPKITNFAFCVNVTDIDTIKFLDQFDFEEFQHEVVLEDYIKINLAVYFNILYDRSVLANYPGTVVSMLGDDMVFLTPHWDQLLLEQINFYKGIGVFWCNDDYISHERCPVNLFVTKEMVDLTERKFMVEEFAADMIDYIWGKVGKYTGTSHYYPDIHIWHNHNTAKDKGLWDETYLRLSRVQAEAHKIGKERAKQIAHEIADTVLRNLK